LTFQLRTLKARGLKATFFVDPLFSFALGISPLRDVISAIRESGQEVALHLRPEWLTDPRASGLPAFAGPYMRDYSEEAQCRLIEVGVGRLKEAGAEESSSALADERVDHFTRFPRRLVDRHLVLRRWG
jgi:hypothetical protein